MTSTTISEALQHVTTTMPSTTRALGATNENPKGLSLWTLLHEDFRTYGSFLEPGFWAVAVHRFGNARMSIRFRPLRAPLTALYHVLYRVVMWLWGIDLGYTVKLGRRVRIWHHGGIVIGAKKIGDDVHIRQNTTLGLLHRGHDEEKPTIGDRVDIGAGACVLGEIFVGDDVVIGANSVVVKDVQPGAVMFGVPARPVKLV
jgi:serine O-acetyltransferase